MSCGHLVEAPFQAAYARPGTIWWELQSKLRPVTTYAVFGAAYQEVQITLRPTAACLGEVRKVHRVLRQATWVEGWLEEPWAGWARWVGQGLRQSPCLANSVSQESSDLAPVCTWQLDMGRAQQRNNSSCQDF